MSLQQEMKAQGMNITPFDSTLRSPGAVFQKPPNNERQEEQIASPAPAAESHTASVTSAKSTSSSSSSPNTNTSSSVVSSSSHPPPDREKDKSFGKMSHYVNELKKELDHACRSRKENLLETQRLRERCVQMEEKLQSEKQKNILLEEQLENSLRKQKELQSLLDAALLSSQSQQQQPQPQQSVGLQVENNDLLPSAISLPTPLGTPTPSSVPCAASAVVPPPNLTSSASGPISMPSSTNVPLIPTKSNSTSNIPSLCGIPTIPLNLSSSSLVNLSSSSSSSLQTLDPLSSVATTVPSASILNSPRFVGSTTATTGSHPPHDPSFFSLQSTQQGPGSEWTTVNGLPGQSEGGGGGNQYATDLQVVVQSDEFDNFIASRGAPSDEWTAADSISVTVPIFSTSPTLSI
jgi:hypothetical protein